MVDQAYRDLDGMCVSVVDAYTAPDAGRAEATVLTYAPPNPFLTINLSAVHPSAERTAPVYEQRPPADGTGANQSCGGVEGHALNIRPDTLSAGGAQPERRAVKSGGAVPTASGFASQAGVEPGPQDCQSPTTMEVIEEAPGEAHAHTSPGVTDLLGSDISWVHEVFHYARKLISEANENHFVLDETAFMEALEPLPSFLRQGFGR